MEVAALAVQVRLAVVAERVAEIPVAASKGVQAQEKGKRVRAYPSNQP